MTKKTVILVQLPVPYLNWEEQKEDDSLAIGYLKAYADRYQNRWEIRFLPENIRLYGADSVIIEHILQLQPQMVGFSLYCWNIQRSIHIGQKIKKHAPSIKILAGGPEVTEDNLHYINTKRIWDYCFIGEAEITFLDFLKNYPRNLDTIPALGIQKRTGLDFHSLQPKKITHLDSIPNPYVEGILPVKDKFIMFETHRGCPYGCYFCYYGKEDRKVRAHSLEYIKNVLDFAMKNKVKNLYLLDPSFNTYPNLKELCALLRQYKKNFTLHTEIKVEALTHNDIYLLENTGLNSAEIGLQTLGKTSRKYLHGSFNLEHFTEKIHLLQKMNIALFIDLIIGLPGDTEDDIKHSVRYVKKHLLKQKDEAQIFHLSVLPGTAVRKNAALWGIKYENKPPYLITSGKDISEKKMSYLMDWAQNYLECYFDQPDYPYCFRESYLPSNPTATNVIPGYNRFIIYPGFFDDQNFSDLFFENALAKHLTLEFFRPYHNIKPIFQFIKEITRRLPHNVLKIIWNMPDYNHDEIACFLNKWESFQKREIQDIHYFQQYYRYHDMGQPLKFILSYPIISAQKTLSHYAPSIYERYPPLLLWDLKQSPSAISDHNFPLVPVLLEDTIVDMKQLDELMHVEHPIFFRNPLLQSKWIKNHKTAVTYPPLAPESVKILS